MPINLNFLNRILVVFHLVILSFQLNGELFESKGDFLFLFSKL